MVTEVTSGVKISVDTNYRADYSNPNNFHYLFSYKITIENMNDHTVQLLRRHWFINDSSGEYREVEGEGVVGQQPVLQPGESYTYESACNLSTDIGTMKGVYLFRKVLDGTMFNAKVPEFKMVVPFRLN